MDQTHTIAKKKLLHVGPSVLRIENTTAGFNDGTWEETRYDIDQAVQPDIVGSMTDMSMVPSDSFDAIYSAHNIEHVYPHEVSVVLAQFLEKLTPTGIVVMTCPDLQAVAQLIAEDKLDEPAYMSLAGPICSIDIVYGLRTQLALGNHYMAHKCGFTAKTLMSSFLNVGFKRAIVSRSSSLPFCLWIAATKDMATDEFLNQLALAHFSLR